jgi:predicted nuclease of predicted toxin-antitoxin system
LGLLHAPDVQMFMAARAAGAVILTKDRDFVRLLDEHGPPPQVLWVTCGNTSTQRLSQVLGDAWPIVADMLSRGEALIEIGDSALPRSR